MDHINSLRKLVQGQLIVARNSTIIMHLHITCKLHVMHAWTYTCAHAYTCYTPHNYIMLHMHI